MKQNVRTPNKRGSSSMDVKYTSSMFIINKVSSYANVSYFADLWSNTPTSFLHVENTAGRKHNVLVKFTCVEMV